MQTKSSARGKGSVINLRNRNASQSATGASRTHLYGMGPWEMSRVDPILPYDTWLMYQAQSFLCKPVTLEEAKELWAKIDINTRKPIATAKQSRLSAFLAALRARFGG